MDAGFTACVFRPSCLKPRHSDGKRGLRLLAKPRFTDFSIEPRLASARDGTKPRLKGGPTAWGVRDKLGSSAAQMCGAAVSRTGGSRKYTGPVLYGLNSCREYLQMLPWVHFENKTKTQRARVRFNITGNACPDYMMNNPCFIEYCII